jgi:hypothetical protein
MYYQYNPDLTNTQVIRTSDVTGVRKNSQSNNKQINDYHLVTFSPHKLVENLLVSNATSTVHLKHTNFKTNYWLILRTTAKPQITNVTNTSHARCDSAGHVEKWRRNDRRRQDLNRRRCSSDRWRRRLFGLFDDRHGRCRRAAVVHHFVHGLLSRIEEKF